MGTYGTPFGEFGPTPPGVETFVDPTKKIPEYPEFDRVGLTPALEAAKKLRTGSSVLIERPDGKIEIGIIRSYDFTADGIDEKNQPASIRGSDANIYHDVPRLQHFLSKTQEALTSPSLDEQGRKNAEARAEGLDKTLKQLDQISVQGIYYNPYVRVQTPDGKVIYRNTNKQDRKEGWGALTDENLKNSKIKSIFLDPDYIEPDDFYFNSTVKHKEK